MAIGVPYCSRNPEATVLYRLLADELETFLARRQECDRPVPGFVEREFRAAASWRALRLYCPDCGRDRLLAFSRKARVWCPSCARRRMADTAAHLVDRVFPAVKVRQWVLSLPFALRYRLAYDARLTTDVLNVFIRALFGDLRRRAKRLLGLCSTQSGAVTFIQHFGDALNANLHFHSMVIDGVYAAGPGGRPEFYRLPAPDDDEVLRLTALIAQRTRSLLERRGLGTEADPQHADPLSEDDPGMAALVARSVGRRIAVGSNTGRRVVRVGDWSTRRAWMPSNRSAPPWFPPSACTPTSRSRLATGCAWNGCCGMRPAPPSPPIV